MFKFNTLLIAMLVAAGSAQAADAPRFIYGPYKHLAMWKNGSHALTLEKSAYIVDGKRTVGPGALTWAFATGECGDEAWGDESAQDIAGANVAAFDRAGVAYLVSTGGQGGVFTCATDDGMERFISRYESKHLIGLDFDIEAEQTPAQVDSLIARIKVAQQKRPQLRYSFTIATHAASDGSLGSLNKQGEKVLDAVRRHGLRDAIFNLMVMDYGPGERKNCVLNKAGNCDMGKSAIQAARNVHAKYKIPYRQIALTAMIGVNDVVSNVFTLDDARLLGRSARTMKLAGLHYWSLDRDTPCATPVTGASPVCSTLPVPAGAYNKAFAESIGQ